MNLSQQISITLSPGDIVKACAQYIIENGVTVSRTLLESALSASGQISTMTVSVAMTSTDSMLTTELSQVELPRVDAQKTSTEDPTSLGTTSEQPDSLTSQKEPIKRRTAKTKSHDDTLSNSEKSSTSNNEEETSPSLEVSTETPPMNSSSDLKSEEIEENSTVTQSQGVALKDKELLNHQEAQEDLPWKETSTAEPSLLTTNSTDDSKSLETDSPVEAETTTTTTTISPKSSLFTTPVKR